MSRLSPAPPDRYAEVTLATPLEPDALTFAEKHLAPSGWRPAAHAPKPSE